MGFNLIETGDMLMRIRRRRRFRGSSGDGYTMKSGLAVFLIFFGFGMFFVESWYVSHCKKNYSEPNKVITVLIIVIAIVSFILAMVAEANHE